MRPQSIIKFDQLFLAMIMLGLVGLGINWDWSIAQFDSNPGLSQLGWNAAGMLIGIFAFSTAINLLLWYFISRRASNVARWILTVLTGYGLISVPFSFFLVPVPLSSLIIGLVAAALQAAMLWFLFRPDAAAWFKHGPRGMDADVFD